jgi:hypothetical protein
MTRAASKSSIVITGEVLGWNETSTDERSIEVHEAEAFEDDGFAVVELGGQLLTFKTLVPNDGDITIQAKLDAKGRMAVAGSHANLGYSGYFVGYVFLAGKQRRWSIFVLSSPMERTAMPPSSQRGRPRLPSERRSQL